MIGNQKFSKFVCMYVYMYRSVYVYMYHIVYVYMHMYVRMYMYIYIYIYIYIHMHVCTYVKYTEWQYTEWQDFCTSLSILLMSLLAFQCCIGLRRPATLKLCMSIIRACQVCSQDVFSRRLSRFMGSISLRIYGSHSIYAYSCVQLTRSTRVQCYC
jgi:hypothetical protein